MWRWLDFSLDVDLTKADRKTISSAYVSVCFKALLNWANFNTVLQQLLEKMKIILENLNCFWSPIQLDVLEFPQGSQIHGSLMNQWASSYTSLFFSWAIIYCLFKCRGIYIRWYLIRGDLWLPLENRWLQICFSFPSPTSLLHQLQRSTIFFNVRLFKKAQHYSQIPTELQYPVCTAANSVSIIMPDKPSWPTTFLQHLYNNLSLTQLPYHPPIGVLLSRTLFCTYSICLNFFF